MKTVLITGGSKGIGSQLSTYFSLQDYDVITVARTGNVTEKGDITDEEFRKYLSMKYTPHVFINNAGIAKESFENVTMTNGYAAVDLLHKFYNKMQNGHIINIGSAAANINGYTTKDLSDAAYIISKRNLKEASTMFQQMHLKPIKVTLLEIGAVATTIQNRFHGVNIPQEQYQNQTVRSIPMLETDVVNCIDWILNSPEYLEIASIELNNFVNPKYKSLR